MASIEVTGPAGTLARSVSTVAVAVAISSAAGYVLLLACGRLLAPDDFAVLLAFWGVSFGLGSALSSVEQEIARITASSVAEGREAGGAARQVMTVGLALAALASAGLFVPALGRAVLGNHRALTPLIALAAVGFVVQFGARGILIGHGHVKPYGWLVVTEPAVRLAVVAVAVAAGFADLFGLALSVALGSFAWLALALPAGRLVGWRGGYEPWLPVVRRVLALVAAASLTAAVITGYPALVTALTPGSPDSHLGALFAALTVSRIPLLAAIPLQAVATPHVVSALARDGGARTVRRWLVAGLLAAVGLASCGAIVSAALGADVVRLLYGGRYQVSGGTVAALVVSAFMLGALVLTCSVLVALRRYGSVTCAWGLVAMLAVAVLIGSPGDAAARAVHGLLIGPAVGLAAAARGCFNALGGEGKVSFRT